MKTLNRTIAAAGVLLASTVGGAFAETFHLSHVLAADDPANVAALKFAEEVKAKTQGRVEIQVHPAASLSGLKDGVEGVRLGTVDMSLPDSGTIGNWVSEIGILNLPFMFSSWEHADKVFDSSVDKWFGDALRQNVNAVLLSAAPIGFRVIMTKDKEVNAASDLAGIKMRVPEIPVLIATFGAVGANVSPIPWGESYTALQTGVVEGIEGSPVALNGLRAHEVTKFAARTNHILLDALLIVNAQKFDALSPEDQQVLRTAAKEIMGDWLYEQRRGAEDTAWSTMGQHVKANSSPDIQSFRDAMGPVVSAFVEKNKLQAVYDELRGLDK
jgi:tripartite ATP-independent transporter DctP family solute receptor